MTRTFAKGSPLYEIEVMMTSVPNFKPRTSGTYIYKKMKDAEAGKCIYCADRKKKAGCKHDICPYILERVELGTLDYGESLKEIYSNIKNRKFNKRLDKLTSNFDGNMFINEEHRYRFEGIIRETRKLYGKPNNRYITAIYLLSTTSDLWNMVSGHMNRKEIDFSKVQLKNMNPDTYAYYQTAKTIYTGASSIEFGEIIDEEVIPDEVFKIITHASLIRLYGKDILSAYH